MTNESKASNLQELFDLFKSGALTKEEFELLKKDIIQGSDSDGTVNQRIQENAQPKVSRKPTHGKIRNNKWVWSVVVVAIIAVSVLLYKMFDTDSGTFKDPRDGKTYKLVKIGDQVWMAENLAYKPSSGNYWAYDNDQSNVSIYGYLYDWDTACQVCPKGWHLPSDDEWTELTDYLGDNPGGKLKATGTIEAGTGLWYDPNTGATNETGFTALLGGSRSSGGFFAYIGDYGNWWSSTETSTDRAWSRRMFYDLSDVSDVGRRNYGKELGFSVRCLRD